MNFTAQRALIVLALFAVVASHRGCDQSASQPATLPTTNMRIGDRAFTIEVAKTEPDRERGLMNRDSMPADHGMIFVFRDNAPRSFWMRNTRIPLDIVFVNPDGQIVSIHTMKPYDLSSTESDGPAMYAIELNAGVASELKLKPGDKIDIPSEARQTKE